jgi:phosphoribosylformimino-5-aminoimidazole carboxamide ribotide isomerase
VLIRQTAPHSLRKLTVIPAVDLLGDHAVRLRQGDYDRVTNRRADPLGLVESYRDAGAELIHLVDLGGARSGELRPDIVRRAVVAAAPARVQASGGIRSTSDAERLLSAGAARVVVGTAAFSDDDALQRFAAALGEHLVVAVDVRDGHVAVGGWTQATMITVDDAAERCNAAGVPRILCTAIDRDGTLSGPDVDLLQRVAARARMPVLAAGGVRSHDDLAAIAEAGCEAALVGRAFLEGRLPLSVLRAWRRESESEACVDNVRGG